MSMPLRRLVAVFALVGLAAAAAAAPPAAATLEADRLTRKLPDTYSDFCVGGGGRYFFFFLPRPGKIAMFDVGEARIVHEFPASDVATKFAAGRDFLIIALPSQRLLQRWSLKTFDRDLSVPYNGPLPVQSVLMGHDAVKPFVVNGVFYDARTLQPTGVTGAHGQQMPPLSDRGVLTSVSADGTVLSAWSANASGLNSPVYVLSGNELRHPNQLGVEHFVAEPRGRAVFTLGGVYAPELGMLQSSKDGTILFLPAAQGNLCLGVRRTQRAGQPELDVAAYVAGDPRPLVQVGQFRGDYEANFVQRPYSVRNRVVFVPDARVVVTLPVSNDVIELTRFDLDEALAKADIDYLFVASDPPAVARTGGQYTHQLVVKSRRGGVAYKLQSGPPSMTVSAVGRIDWPVPPDAAGQGHVVRISVTDASEQEVVKTFIVRIGP
jgi:hypothetical protein